MTKYLGDYVEDQTIDFKWSSNEITGGSVTPTTAGTVSVYKGNSATQTTTGVTDTRGFDSLAGVHHCRIVTTDSFYEAGYDYQVVLSGAVIDGETVNAEIASFSIENRSSKGADSDALIDDFWNESLAGHTGALTLGSYIIQLVNALTNPGSETGQAQGGGNNTITLAATANANNNWYNGRIISIYGDTGVGQARIITAYNGSTKVATVNRNWVTNPDATSDYVINHLAESIATELGDLAKTSVAGAVWDAAIASHTGAATFGGKNQNKVPSETLADYKATGFSTFNPSTTPVELLATGGSAGKNAEEIVDDIWDELIASHVAAGSFGAKNQKVVPSETLADYKANVANLDVAVSSRSNHGPNDVRDAILSDSTPFSGANIDAAISTRATPANVDTEIEKYRLDEIIYAAAAAPAAGSFLGDLLEDDGGQWRFNANALEQGASASNPNVLVDTTIASITSQVIFTLTAGSSDDDAYKDQSIVLYDAGSGDKPSVRVVTGYVGATKQVTIDAAPDFTIATTDGVKIFVTAPGTSAPTAAQVADAVWDEAASGHVAGGSFGDKLQNKIPSALISDYRATGFAVPGSQMNLADDAITASKFDETTAFPLKSADTGSTAVARTGADGDTLETLSDQVDAIPAAPSAAVVADAVWDEAQAGHVAAGSFGSLVDAKISERASATYFTQARAGYLDKLNVTGTLAHTDNASSFMATKTSLGLPAGIKKNTAIANFLFQLKDSSGNLKTGETVTAQVLKDGAASYVSMTNAVVEVAGGTYRINVAAADVNCDFGAFRFSSPNTTGFSFFFMTEP